jgi:apolipoprotein N-acyltransferase
MLPWRIEEEPELMRFFLDFAKRSHSAVILGSQEHVPVEKGVQYYNSAYYLDNSGRVAGRYRKQFLAPIGEYVPFKDWMPLLPKFFGLFTPYGTSGFNHGNESGIFELGGRKFGILICFEISAPELVRKLKSSGADFVVTISNDAWFEDSAELDLAREQALIRAVESRIGIVRTVNGGISSFIDPVGRARDLEAGGARKMVEGRMFGSIAYTNSGSTYAEIGDVFAAILGFIVILTLVYLLYKRWKRKSADCGREGQK